MNRWIMASAILLGIALVVADDMSVEPPPTAGAGTTVAVTGWRPTTGVMTVHAPGITPASS